MPRPRREAPPRPRPPHAARAALAAAGLLCLCAAPREASAQGLVFRLPVLGQASYTFTDTTIATYRHDNFDENQYDDRVFALTERFDSFLTAAPFRAQLRIDGFAPFLTRPIPADCHLPTCNDYLRPDLRVERFALRYQRNGVTVEAGDVYTVIGRGTALAFRKVDPLGLDTTIRGGRAEIDGEWLTARAFGGYVNPQNLDPITLQVNHDWGDAIARGDETLRPGPDVLGGADIAGRFGPNQDIEFGLHGLRVHFPQNALRDYDVDVLGYRVSAPALADGAVALYGEAHVLRRTETDYRSGGIVDGMPTRGPLARTLTTFGRALYASAQGNFGPWSVLLEAKDYDNFLVSPDGGSGDVRRIYSAAPSLERDDVQLRTNSNTRAARVRLERAFRPGPWSAAVTVLGGGMNEHLAHDAWASDAIGVVHGYMTVRRRVRGGAGGEGGGGGLAMPGLGLGASGPATTTHGDWQMSGSVGYRHEFLLAPQMPRQSGAPDWQTVHGDVDVAFPVTGSDSLDIRLDVRFERRWSPDRNEGMGDYYWYTRSGLALTWAHGERLTVSLAGRVDNQAYEQGKTRPPVIYPSGEIRYTFLPGSFVRLFGGATPGGRICTGGVCRDVPPFAGGLMELVLRI